MTQEPTTQPRTIVRGITVHPSWHAEDDVTMADFQATQRQSFDLVRASVDRDFLLANRGRLSFTWRMSFPWSRDRSYPWGRNFSDPHAAPAAGPVTVYLYGGGSFDQDRFQTARQDMETRVSKVMRDDLPGRDFFHVTGWKMDLRWTRKEG